MTDQPPADSAMCVWEEMDGLNTELRAYLDWFDGFDDRNFAAVQGAANFTPAMLPKLWHDHPCPYSTPLYKEAWYRGLYSAACWYLIDSLARMAFVQPSLQSMFHWYLSEHPRGDWVRVPAGRELTESEATP